MPIGTYLNNLVKAALGRNAPLAPPAPNNPILGDKTTIFTFGTTEVYANISTNNAIEKGFESNTAVYSIVMKDANKFGSIPRYVYDASTKEEKAIRGVERKAQPKYKKLEGSSPLTELLNRPNPYESQDMFFAKVRAYFKICGEAFIFLNRDMPDGLSIYEDTSKYPVLEMRAYPPDKITCVSDPDDVDGVLYYKLNNGRPIDIRKTDMIHWKATNLGWDANTREHLRGFPAAAAGAKTIEENNSLSLANMRQAQNSGGRGALVNKTLGARPSPTQATQIKAAIDTKLNDNNTSGSVVALEGDWAYLDTGRSAVDMDLREAKKQTWVELCALYDLPYEMIDPGTTFANKLQAQKGWISNTIMPACKQLDGELNRVLLVAFGIKGTVFIGSDYSELPEMQIDMQAMATALAAAWWFTPNEKREMMAEEPYDDATMDEIWPPSGTAPMSEQQANTELDRQLLRQGMNDNANANDSKRPGG